MIKKINYSDEELEYRKLLIQRATFAKNQRDDSHPEFDDMTYSDYYESNSKAANSYIPPKENKEDTRVVTGTTHEKENTLLSSILNYNLEPDITSFDQYDLPISELGEGMELLLKKSRELEDYDTNKILIYKELLDQGNVFVEEVWEECIKPQKKLKNIKWSEGIDPKKIKWEEKLEKVYGQCRTRLLSGLKVYLGNIKEPRIQFQPYIFTAEIVHYNEAKSIYQNWERWKYVPEKLEHGLDLDTSNITYQDWSLNEFEDDYVEILKYYDKWGNELMIMLNGVMMLPPKFPLTAVSPSGDYPIAKGDCESIPFFAYAKSIPAKTKVDQAILDEMLKLIILKTRKSFKPPLANNTNRVVSSKIFMPGTITSGIDASKLVPIGGDINGVNAGEFSAFQLIKQIVDEKSVSPVFTGDVSKGSQTATEIIELKKQSMMKLGLVMYGILALEKQLAWLRLNNILANWTKPIDSKVDDIKNKIVNIYRQFTTEGYYENGRKGNKMVKFTEEMPGENEMQGSYMIKAEEDMMKRPGQEVRIVYLNPIEIGKAKLFWKIDITPTEKDTTELRKVLFKQFVVDTLTLFGPQSVNLDYVKERWATLAGEDPDRFFSRPQQQNILAQMAGQMGNSPQNPVEAQMMPKLSLQPSINTLVNA